MRRAACALAFLASAASARAREADGLSAAWLQNGHVESRTSDGGALPASVPLGSLWKLFVYAYAVERDLETPVYRCHTPARDGEEYCCEPGGRVERDPALARSCALFFEPTRLGITPGDWKAFWKGRADAEALWLLDLAHLVPETRVPVSGLLEAVAAVPPAAREAAARALLPVMIDGYGQGTTADVGGRLRVKTFTWKDAKGRGSYGGGAGWLLDGTPVWFGGPGSSRQVLRDAAPSLARWLPAPRFAAFDDPCVVVDYFERYGIRSVDHLPSRERAQPGPLDGRFRVQFENGNTLTFVSRGELRLDRDDGTGHLQIHGKLAESEYVARVVDREGDARSAEAARALALAARTWLIQNAPFEAGCYRVADSTRAQRVSASAASAPAREAALFSHGLILKGQTVRYHQSQAEPGVLSWEGAVAAAQEGRRFDAILAQAFPRASIAALSGEEECRHLPAAEAWLSRVTPEWQRRLLGRPGFDPPAEPLTVCGLDYGNPYADRPRRRIHVRGVATREDRLTIAHEYVHMAFQFHPNGSDESFVERTARTLAE